MKLLILAALAVGTQAAATPTYLSCTIDQGATELQVEVTADEEQQRATISLPSTGRAVTRPALFSPSEVQIEDRLGVWVDNWVIDRVNLGIQRRASIGDKLTVHSGKCVIKPAPAKRAF